ncbi:MAG TPA: hypothetical protein DCE39_07210 [Planctomycetaceae bacterium]|jgi:hypothetical protein|nr:hypothetical protein [Planctomycetales bacterium]GIS57914.1 MAG: hypothetical protein CM1200mP2_01390 [Planctomycetaceae bacterium]HAA60703.1 hypothetical protein [Planctomycetaceae bacterium]|tara:strand:+ start:1600 stop:1833 length:234 start_codon:yes stop_codon:yes gene_type:complete
MTSTFLHDIGDTIRNAMATVPLSLVGWAFVAIPLVLLVWVLKCPIGDDENRDPKQVRLLRIGAALALVLQIVIYGLL